MITSTASKADQRRFQKIVSREDLEKLRKNLVDLIRGRVNIFRLEDVTEKLEKYGEIPEDLLEKLQLFETQVNTDGEVKTRWLNQRKRQEFQDWFLRFKSTFLNDNYKIDAGFENNDDFNEESAASSAPVPSESEVPQRASDEGKFDESPEAILSQVWSLMKEVHQKTWDKRTDDQTEETELYHFFQHCQTMEDLKSAMGLSSPSTVRATPQFCLKQTVNVCILLYSLPAVISFVG